LARQDGKRPDGLTLIPWQRGKPLTWDVTVAHTLADSYVSVTARSGGAAAEQAAADFTFNFAFNPIDLYTQGYKNNNIIIIIYLAKLLRALVF